ncbi:MAG TPA: DoxX family protein [Ktedonobacteraceae bacterium]|nr:DoxX family protein [Ktedonobacteraceae bacterium]
MNIALWIVQALLALVFVAAGLRKATQPIDTLAVSMKWAKDFSSWIVRAIGALEILGGIGVILPAATGILPWLTPVAAIGLVLTMVGAMILHMRRGEMSHIGLNVILLLLALFIVFGRFVAVPLA